MRCLLALVLLSLSSCSRSETRPPAADATPAPLVAARGPVSARCGAAPCRDYSTAAAHIRKIARPGQGPGCSDASIGRCGAARYIRFSDGFSAYEEYFDASGAMIAAYTRADIDPEGGWYGPAQFCERLAEVVLCRDGGYVDAGIP